ncbi:MAG: hypothetical protein A4E65_02691 [Syntrophorhabdus sp. PtaU1.Bin153]|nr:MAG: hypothetical protein A4E65_02691 [Syntrophorhabdus sp. PtaU1.Bin153]
MGPEEDVLPTKPAWTKITENHEATGIGTIFWRRTEPQIHFHGMFGKRDTVKMGCLREFARVFIIVEAIIVEIKGVSTRKRSR